MVFQRPDGRLVDRPLAPEPQPFEGSLPRAIGDSECSSVAYPRSLYNRFVVVNQRVTNPLSRFHYLTNGRIGQSGSAFPSNSRPPCDVDGDAPRLVLRQDVGLSSFGVTVASRHGSCPKILHQMMKENGTGLPVGVPNDVAAGDRFGSPGSWQAAAVIRGGEGETAGRRMASTSPA
jgi:hypothetical protein